MEYYDLLALSFAPIVLHVIALLYLAKIRKFLGRSTLLLMVMLGGVEFAWAAIIPLQIITTRELHQAVHPLGLFIGFLLPLSVSLLMMLLIRQLSKGFIIKAKVDSSSSSNSENRS